MNVTIVSPYHGGSHEAWAAGYSSASDHTVEILSLPARFWKWRMHGGAVTLARRFMSQEGRPDLILATSMLDLTTFLSLTRTRTFDTPVALYMHENQLTYPLPEDPTTGAMRRQHGERDQHYAFINFASMLAADRVLFNSPFHLESWFGALPSFLKHFPEHNEMESVERLRQKSEVLPVGIDSRDLDAQRPGPEAAAEERAVATLKRATGTDPSSGSDPTSPPLILWNQRWEYDKNPGAFFDALHELADEGIPFRVALCGESFSQQPAVFETAIERLGDRIEHVGFADRSRYAKILWEADVTCSTAHHEFFGIAILEAVYCGTFPVLPDHLSYPELMPREGRERYLYSDRQGFMERLRWALENSPEATRLAREVLAPHAAGYAWERLAPTYDRVLADISKASSAQV